MKLSAKTPKKTINLQVNYLKVYSMAILMASVLLLWQTTNSHLNIFMLLSAVLVMFATGLMFLSRYLAVVQEVKNLDVAELVTLNMDTVSTISDEYREKNNKAGTFLGKGFIWNNQVAENYFTLTQEPAISKLITSEENDRAGQYIIHNIGRSEDKYRVFDLPEHTAVIGTTGVGKSTLLTLMAAQRIKDNEAVIIIDPKGDKDVLNNVYRIACSLGKKDSFRFFSLAHLGKSQTYNPFVSQLSSNDIASRIKNILGSSGSEDVFPNLCWAAVNAAADLLRTIGESVTIKEIYKSLFVAEASLVAAANAKIESLLKIAGTNTTCGEYVQAQAIQSSIDVFNSTIMKGGEHTQKMIVALKPILTVLGTKELGANLATLRPSISWNDVFTNRRIVYFYLGSMIDDMAASALGKLIFQDLLGQIGKNYAYKYSHHPVSLFCDEVYNIVFEGMADMLSKSRGANIRVNLFMQTQADIAVKTKLDYVNVIFGNINNSIVFRTPEKELSERLAEEFGEIFYAKRIITKGTSATLGSLDQLFKDSQSERLDRQAGALIPELILRNLAVGHAIAHTKGMPVYKLITPYLKTNDLSDIDFFKIINNEIIIDNTIKSDIAKSETRYMVNDLGKPEKDILFPGIFKPEFTTEEWDKIERAGLDEDDEQTGKDEHSGAVKLPGSIPSSSFDDDEEDENNN